MESQALNGELNSDATYTGAPAAQPPAQQPDQNAGAPKLNFAKLNMGIHRGTARHVDDGPRYIYLARYSPLCKCVKWSCFSYLVILVIMIILLTINTSYCGLDSSKHIVRMRNVTYPIGDQGLAQKNDYESTIVGVKDKVYQFLLSNVPADAALEAIPSQADFTIPSFSLGVLLNSTYGTAKINSLSFSTKKQTSQLESGRAFDIVLENPKRTRIETAPAWFNFDYWYSNTSRFNISLNGDKYQHPMCAQDILTKKVVNSTEPTKQWYVGNTNSQLSVMPLWVLNLNNLIDAPHECEKDFTVEFQVDPWFCFAPIFVRQYPGVNPITFNQVSQLRGDIVIDIAENDRTKVQYVFNNSIVDRVWLTKPNSVNEIKIDIVGANTISFMVPNPELQKFYGLSGNKSTTEQASELYQMEYNLNPTIQDGAKIIFSDPIKKTTTNTNGIQVEFEKSILRFYGGSRVYFTQYDDTTVIVHVT